MTHHSSKSYSSYSPPSLSEVSDAYSTRRALSRLKSDGQSFFGRISSKLRRTESQHEKSKTLEYKLSTTNLRECDSRYELARYVKRREQIQLVSAADPRLTRKDSSANLTANSRLPPTIGNKDSAEKTRWKFGLKHYLSTRNKENLPEKHHRKSKSAPASAFESTYMSDSSQQEIPPADSSYSGILLKKPSSRSLKNTAIPKTIPITMEHKPYSLPMNDSAIPTSILDQPQNLSYLLASNITVKSEDLTAKEFADITGIKICSDDEISEANLATVKSNCLSQKTSNGSGDEEMHSLKSLHSTPHTTIHSTCNRQGSSGCHSRSSSTNKRLQIWEQEFWTNSPTLPSSFSKSGSQDDIQAQMACYPLSKSKSLQEHHNDESKHISRRRNTTHNATSPLMIHQGMINSGAQLYAEMLPNAAKLFNTTQSQAPVLRRGRFEITIENATTDSQLVENTNPKEQNQLSQTTLQNSTIRIDNAELTKGDIIEWKRKKK
ncbi:hypothetical protein INT43_004188 [Umbelopsis isabellina]|uniref:Uncharacterized protein n=1 Tax=Mortierella isabellina TaxID=91625 RepID=A0A8H7PHP8_MORIS|nr:hypothetical protein INT43_004188 [Umbelopsis isabellina]